MQSASAHLPPGRNAAAAGSAQLCQLNYDSGITDEALFEAHRQWARRHAAPLYPRPGARFGADDGGR